jgi:hypothetical protein
MMPVHKRKTVRVPSNRSGAPRGGRPAWTLRRLRKLVCGARDVRRDASRLRACVIGPRTGAAAPERLSALRFPRSFEGKHANLGGLPPRENDDACAELQIQWHPYAMSHHRLRCP